MSDRQLAERVMVIASGNAGKIREFTNLLAHLPLDIKPQPTDLNVEETGSSFAENARIKATAVAKATGHWALADDSGLSVIALNGAPGVHSARYAPTDSQRISRLLRELDGIENRHAHFNAAL
ncbi:MAG: non-canonical purine NTP pyrophosphatase, partial [Prochlorococcus sp.]